VEADEVARPNKTSSALHYNVASFEESPPVAVTGMGVDLEEQFANPDPSVHGVNGLSYKLGVETLHFINFLPLRMSGNGDQFFRHAKCTPEALPLEASSIRCGRRTAARDPDGPKSLDQRQR
jgi:hypothetical protein